MLENLLEALYACLNIALFGSGTRHQTSGVLMRWQSKQLIRMSKQRSDGEIYGERQRSDDGKRHGR